MGQASIGCGYSARSMGTLVEKVDAALIPLLEFALELRVKIGPTLELGNSPEGIRRTVPILGGAFNGPRISGLILPGGVDWQFF